MLLLQFQRSLHRHLLGHSCSQQPFLTPRDRTHTHSSYEYRYLIITLLVHLNKQINIVCTLIRSLLVVGVTDACVLCCGVVECCCNLLHLFNQHHQDFCCQSVQ